MAHFSFVPHSADCKRGRRKGATSKKRQKSSKSVKKRQKVFRHFSTIFAQGKKRQKSSKSVKKFFDTFRQFSRGAKIFFRPLLQSADSWIAARIAGGRKSGHPKTTSRMSISMCLLSSLTPVSKSQESFRQTNPKKVGTG